MPASDAEFEAFAATCDRLAGFDDRIDPFYVDGWLAALACGPVRLPASQWLELMCDDAFDRAFADPPDRAQALGSLQARLDVLHRMLDAEALLDQPDSVRLDPYFDEWGGGEEGAVPAGAAPAPGAAGAAAADTVEVAPAGATGAPPAEPTVPPGTTWAEGVIDALHVLAAPGGPWGLAAGDTKVSETIEEFGDQVLALLLDVDGDEYREFVARFHPGRTLDRDELLLNACFALQDLRLFLLDHGPRPETRRVEKQPGRNDPCPCGSGKKFKKCHGAAESA